ncbi:MAG: hypothetical protein GY828_03205 [Candidatus Gracilibacteria bacterium]|nr:hypothetical protein [Candidatus Gracilibacteria bacterium]
MSKILQGYFGKNNHYARDKEENKKDDLGNISHYTKGILNDWENYVENGIKEHGNDWNPIPEDVTNKLTWQQKKGHLHRVILEFSFPDGKTLRMDKLLGKGDTITIIDQVIVKMNAIEEYKSKYGNELEYQPDDIEFEYITSYYSEKEFSPVFSGKLFSRVRSILENCKDKILEII